MKPYFLRILKYQEQLKLVMATRLTLAELKEKVRQMEKYIESHPSFDGWSNWPNPELSGYLPLKWIMEYHHGLKNSYYRRNAKVKNDEV